jgi:DNA-binding GntR family transcriptional regulator
VSDAESRIRRGGGSERAMTDLLPMAPHLIRRTALIDDVWSVVRGLLMSQAIKPGQRITIERLAGDLGVSPTPVREALARLESDGLVTKRPQRGYRASPLLSTEQVDELFDFRRLLEPWAASQVARRAGPEVGALLETEVEDARGRFDRSAAEPYRQVFDHDVRFHRILLDACGNGQVSAAFARTHCHLHMLRIQSAAPVVGATMAEHRDIAVAVSSADARAAARAMRIHLAESQQRALASLRDRDEAEDSDRQRSV